MAILMINFLRLQINEKPIDNNAQIVNNRSWLKRELHDTKMPFLS